MREIADDRRDATSLTTGATASTLGLDMGALFARHASDCYELYGRHGNEQLVRMLKVAGYDVDFCRGEGRYLYDHNGTRYLDLLRVSACLLSAAIIRRSRPRSEACSTVICHT